MFAAVVGVSLAAMGLSFALAVLPLVMLLSGAVIVVSYVLLEVTLLRFVSQMPSG